MKASAITSIAAASRQQHPPGGLRHAFGAGLEDRNTAPRSLQLRLTSRQREVLALLCEGLPNKLICRRLDISPGTVKSHISSILRELGVSSRLQAVVAARDIGLLDAPPASLRRESVTCLHDTERRA